MLRGDDVAELQQRLCTLGFDTGRVDGIFGDATVRALGEFQRNAGLPVDGIVGGATLAELLRLESRHHDPELVSAVRARAALRDAPPTLRGRHVAVGESGGLGSVAGALRRRLHLRRDPGDRAAPPRRRRAGQGGQRARGRRLRRAAAQPLGLRLPHRLLVGHPRRVPRRAAAGRAGPAAVPAALGVADAGVHGMSVPLLRETRMPAVLIEVGPGQHGGRAGAAPGRRALRRPRPLGRRLLGLITGN